ncbi:hypothetical protein F5Y19DRAFT_478792 [Xylariaceae sp. FL1651]|nr:hypothetical protein F5Y19DRAFT_478792 [Xylariaceae sp. FL1651]
MSTEVSEEILKERTDLYRSYKQLEAGALSSLLDEGEEYWVMSTRQLQERIHERLHELSTEVKDRAASALERSNTLRQQASNLYSGTTHRYRSHIFWHRLIESIIKALRLPNTASAVVQAETIIQQTDTRDNDQCNLVELEIFIEELGQCKDMITELWVKVANEQCSLVVADIASGCMLKYIMTVINAAQLVNSDWFEGTGLLKREYIAKVFTTSSDLVSLLPNLQDQNAVSLVDINALLIAYKEGGIVPLLRSKNVLPGDFSMKLPLAVEKVARKAAEGGRLPETFRDLEVDMMAAVLLEHAQATPEKKHIKRDTIFALTRLLKALRETPPVISEEARVAITNDWIPKLTKFVGKQSLCWPIARIRTWVDMTIHELNSAYLFSSQFSIVAHLFDYHVLYGRSSTIPSWNYFELFCNKFAHGLYGNRGRPRDMDRWKNSVDECLRLWEPRSKSVADRIIESRLANTSPFSQIIIEKGYSTEGQLGSKMAPTEVWWEALQERLQNDTNLPNLARAYTRITANPQFPLRTTLFTVKKLRHLDPQSDAAEINDLLNQVPLDGDWFNGESMK